MLEAAKSERELAETLEKSDCGVTDVQHLQCKKRALQAALLNLRIPGEPSAGCLRNGKYYSVLDFIVDIIFFIMQTVLGRYVIGYELEPRPSNLCYLIK